MLSLAIVGLGWWGRMHIAALHGKSERVRIVRVTDIDAATVASVAGEFKSRRCRRL